MDPAPTLTDVYLSAPEPTPTTIDDRCEVCGWTMFGGMYGGVWCVNPKCTKHHVDILADA